MNSKSELYVTHDSKSYNKGTHLKSNRNMADDNF